MKLQIDKKTFWDVFIYDWRNRKALKKRRSLIQKGKKKDKTNRKRKT